MKARLLFFLVPLLILQLACGLTGRPAQSTSPTPSTAATASSLPDVPPTTTTTPPSPETTSATATPAVLPTSNQLQPSSTLPPEQIGPEILDLSASSLFQNYFLDYTDIYSDVIAGLDPNGQPTSLSVSLHTRYQGQPAQAWFTTDNLFGPDFAIEKAAVNGTLYLVESDTCKQTAAGSPPQSIFSLLPTVLTGQAQRGEMGVEINGLITDQYLLTAQNFIPNAEINLVETSSDGDSTSTNTFTIQIRGTGALYLARAGGFVVRIELGDTALATADDFFFKPGSEMRSTRLFERIATPAGTAPIAPPAACQAAEALKNFVLPRLPDASIVVETDEELIYQTNASVQAVRDFYQQELTALGWTLSEETTLGGMASLTFTLGSQTISITVLGSGANTTVQISKY